MAEFIFICTDQDSEGNDVVTRKTFTTDHWTQALDHFILFVKGAGWLIEKESIFVNADKHGFTDTEIEVSNFSVINFGGTTDEY